jgi:type IV secretory pathway VirB3-like protein
MDEVRNGSSDGAARPARSRGEAYEGIAFTFCKAATVILVCQKLALPIAAGLAALFYLLAYAHGKRDTRCWLRKPLLIAAFWGGVAVVAVVMQAIPRSG